MAATHSQPNCQQWQQVSAPASLLSAEPCPNRRFPSSSAPFGLAGSSLGENVRVTESNVERLRANVRTAYTREADAKRELDMFKATHAAQLARLRSRAESAEGEVARVREEVRTREEAMQGERQCGHARFCVLQRRFMPSAPKMGVQRFADAQDAHAGKLRAADEAMEARVLLLQGQLSEANAAIAAAEKRTADMTEVLVSKHQLEVAKLTRELEALREASRSELEAMTTRLDEIRVWGQEGAASSRRMVTEMAADFRVELDEARREKLSALEHAAEQGAAAIRDIEKRMAMAIAEASSKAEASIEQAATEAAADKTAALEQAAADKTAALEQAATEAMSAMVRDLTLARDSATVAEARARDACAGETFARERCAASLAVLVRAQVAGRCSTEEVTAAVEAAGLRDGEAGPVLDAARVTLAGRERAVLDEATRLASQRGAGKGGKGRVQYVQQLKAEAVTLREELIAAGERTRRAEDAARDVCRGAGPASAVAAPAREFLRWLDAERGLRAAPVVASAGQPSRGGRRVALGPRAANRPDEAGRKRSLPARSKARTSAAGTST